MLASTPGPAHQPCGPRGHIGRGTISAAVESMTSAMSVAMSLMQVPPAISGSASIIAFGTWHRRLGSVIKPKVGQLRSFLRTVPLSPVWCGLAWDADFRVHKIVIRFWCLLRGPADINAADESAVHLLCQDIIQTDLSLASVSALERIGHATFGGTKESVQKSEVIVFYENQQ